MTLSPGIIPGDPSLLEEEKARFAALKQRLPDLWRSLNADPQYPHTSVIVPSLSVNQEELSKVVGAAYYEERLLFALIRLNNPNARLVYITSQPVHPEVVNYYLQFLEGVAAAHARQRLFMLSVQDATARPLSEKVLERPRLLARIREILGDPKRAYLTCYNATALERSLAVALGIPLNGLDPDLLPLGTKSGNRKVFSAAGVPQADGVGDLHERDEVIEALAELAGRRPAARRAVIKLNEGFGGEGNGLFRFPESRQDKAAISSALEQMAWTSPTESADNFFRKFKEMGGVVEEFIEAGEVRSPSVQMRIFPDGEAALVSSHEQVLGGATGQSYLGCRFPADDAYRKEIMSQAWKIAGALSERGVLGRFAVDFLVYRQPGDDWQCSAIEINLRMGGTTPPFHALEFLTGGSLDRESGMFLAPSGQAKFYYATDNLKSTAYRGLLPEDLFEIIAHRHLGYRHATGTGALFYMIDALSQHGKVGVTCIANSPDEARALFDRTVAALDDEASSEGHGVAVPLLDRHLPME